MIASIVSLIVPKIRFVFIFKKIAQSNDQPSKSMLFLGLAVAWRKHGACLLGRACW